MLEKYSSIPNKLNQLLDKRRKIFLIVLFFMALVLSLVETAGVSIVMPFISVASNPETVNTEPYSIFYEGLKFTDTTAFILVFGIAIIIFYIFRSFYNIFYSYCINKFSLGTYRYFANKLFDTYLAMPYKVYVQKNPSILSQMIVTEAHRLSSLLLHLLHIFTESFTVLLLYCFMVMVNWQITLVLTAIMILVIIIVFNTVIRTSKRLGKKRFEANARLSKTIWQTFNNFKFLRLKGNEKEIIDNFNDSTSKLSRAEIVTATLGTIPKNILENLGFSLLIASVCFILWRYGSAAMVIPVISMYALALYRMLPAINRILLDANSIAYNQNSLHKIFEDINLETDQEYSEPISFSKSVRGENLWFSYLTGGNVIKNVSFEIHAGEKVALTGESGSGKTTLADLFIGIYRPMEGSLFIDDILLDNKNIRAWRSKIGYIPQSIYLFDGTVAENVVFGSEHDEEKIELVLKKAKIWNFLETKDGFHTLVGEGGIQLSGGQKQRIGIARALYNDPEVLVLDEATSSLDDTTEAQIMDEIYDISGNKTLIVIAHRLSTIKRCDRHIHIEDGRIV
jgi:ATP-binding cassette subfamily B protein/ATP-binding cassette subfamily C protein